MNNNAIVEKIQSLGLDEGYAKKSTPFALKVKSDVTVKGQTVFNESTLFSGNHGGVAILHLPIEIPATYNFLFLLIRLLSSGSALIFLLLSLPPSASSSVN